MLHTQRSHDEAEAGPQFIKYFKAGYKAAFSVGYIQHQIVRCEDTMNP